MVTIISIERTIWISGFADRREGRNAKGHKTTALNTTWPAKRSQVTWVTGTCSITTRYLAVESSTAKQTVASTMSPMALSLAACSAGEGAWRGVMEARFCINLCQKAIGG